MISISYGSNVTFIEFNFVGFQKLNELVSKVMPPIAPQVSDRNKIALHLNFHRIDERLRGGGNMMHSDFQFVALPLERFTHLFTMDEAELASVGARRMTVDENPGYPCRVSLMDAPIGETDARTSDRFTNRRPRCPHPISRANGRSTSRRLH